MPRSLRLRRRVQFYETDLAGVVHFSWYFRYMEEAEHALWRAAGLSIAAPDTTVRFPRVAASCDYRAPLGFEDEFDVHIEIASMTARAIRYDCTLTRGDTTIATGSLTAACVRVAAGGTMTPVDIPDNVRAALQA